MVQWFNEVQGERVSLFSLEHSKAAYITDFALYGVAVLVLAALLLAGVPRDQTAAVLMSVLAGLAGWTLIEYVLHRFVLHGLRPFSRWHAEHHDRPAALICTPTILSATLIVTLVFVPSLVLGSLWRASALTLGVLTGYLAYAITHHATHHWRGDGAWLKRRKRWHALHHHAATPGFYGVTTPFWDHVFGSFRGAPARRRPARA
jgi:cyclopropane-fatty-acyl-phospholipid synthase